ncbi:hypothetical protein E2C01_087491 [Portunus trituberculatus]|uniref:Uncharacterized protein n=1 Tax=Portunus trituberculatus TaxID=210409 RepID=A0A5B7JDH9_PORTR|nr:hypothetical protein [Portunus trituberculatus]
MASFQGGKWWESNLHVDVCPIPGSPSYPLLILSYDYSNF